MSFIRAIPRGLQQSVPPRLEVQPGDQTLHLLADIIPGLKPARERLQVLAWA